MQHHALSFAANAVDDHDVRPLRKPRCAFLLLTFSLIVMSIGAIYYYTTRVSFTSVIGSFEDDTRSTAITRRVFGIFQVPGHPLVFVSPLGGLIDMDFVLIVTAQSPLGHLADCDSYFNEYFTQSEDYPTFWEFSFPVSYRYERTSEYARCRHILEGQSTDLQWYAIYLANMTSPACPTFGQPENITITAEQGLYSEYCHVHVGSSEQDSAIGDADLSYWNPQSTTDRSLTRRGMNNSCLHWMLLSVVPDETYQQLIHECKSTFVDGVFINSVTSHLGGLEVISLSFSVLTLGFLALRILLKIYNRLGPSKTNAHEASEPYDIALSSLKPTQTTPEIQSNLNTAKDSDV